MERTVIRLHSDVTQHILAECIKYKLSYSKYLNTVITEYSADKINSKLETIEKNISEFAKSRGIILKGETEMKKKKEYQSGEKTQFHIRMSAENMEEIKKEASRQGLTVSSYIENTIRNSKENKCISERLDKIQEMLAVLIEKER